MSFKAYKITSKYGDRIHPIKKQKIFHAGVDLVKVHRSPIESFTDGSVLFAGNGIKGTGLGGYGLCVVVKDDKNKLILYGHLDEICLIKGAKVKKGEKIGYQGATGNVTGSHLHLEVRRIPDEAAPFGFRQNRRDTTVDPLIYFKTFTNAILKRGSKGNNVKECQKALLLLHYALPVYGADGHFGKETEEAIKLFQSNEGLKIDGIIGRNTHQKIQEPSIKYSGHFIQKGSKGKLVKFIQRKLNIKRDGIFGLITEQAVYSFQRNQGLKSDGIVGFETWKSLLNYPLN
ncbi:peptidoglycan-binding protein [Saliterribacillus persicus]|uniref:Putative peptidoglycan binding protein n=1 Tax=Saliterribacillus persicus TaxID=930114 RepID=A0A368XXY4_9BACI|nr:peptidoglycan-binding protein [Saliterribacillus persicus]RCW71996.1 putative peptidoglycan binding protein [Saliterribacillus persicus]